MEDIENGLMELRNQGFMVGGRQGDRSVSRAG